MQLLLGSMCGVTPEDPSQAAGHGSGVSCAGVRSEPISGDNLLLPPSIPPSALSSTFHLLPGMLVPLSSLIPLLQAIDFLCCGCFCSLFSCCFVSQLFLET